MKNEVEVDHGGIVEAVPYKWHDNQATHVTMNECSVSLVGSAPALLSIACPLY